MGIEVAAALTLGDLQDTGDTIVNRIMGTSRPKPLYMIRTKSVVGTGIAAVLNYGSPPVGSAWQIRYITLFGSDDHTAIPGMTASLYVGDPSNLSLMSLRITGLAIPSTTFISRDALWIRPNEGMCLNLPLAISTGQMIGANIAIEEWKEQDTQRNTGK